MVMTINDFIIEKAEREIQTPKKKQHFNQCRQILHDFEEEISFLDGQKIRFQIESWFSDL